MLFCMPDYTGTRNAVTALTLLLGGVTVLRSRTVK